MKWLCTLGEGVRKEYREKTESLQNVIPIEETTLFSNTARGL